MGKDTKVTMSINGGPEIPVDHLLDMGIEDSHRGADDSLRLLIERVERLEEEKKGISDDIRDVYQEAKSRGYDVPAMREIVKLRKMAKTDRDHREAILDTYRAALGLA